MIVLGSLSKDIWSYQPHTKGVLHESIDEIDRDVRWIPKRDKNERVGFPTQKPIGLYSRIIKSSTKENDIVLDPFAGCATTCVAAEILKRRWVGIDIWDNAINVVTERLEKLGPIDPEHIKKTVDSRQTSAFEQDLHFISQPPERTDGGEETVPFLKNETQS